MSSRYDLALAVSAALVFLGLALVFARVPYPTRVDAAFTDLVDGADPSKGFRWGNTASEVTADYVLIVLLDAALAVLAVRYGEIRHGALVMGTAVLAEAASRATKVLVARPRPPGAFATSGAYPSGHVAALAVAVVLFLRVVLPLLRRKGLMGRADGTDAALAGLVVVTYALYRAFTGEHWLTDVVGGASLGLALGLAAGLVAERGSRDRSEKP